VPHIAHFPRPGESDPYGHMGICEKIWSSGVSPKRASKMQLRNVNLRSVGPSVQKLWPTTFFARKMPCILHCNEKKIWTSFSRLDRGLVQKAKWSEIFRRSRIQALPTISNNLCTKCLGLQCTKYQLQILGLVVPKTFSTLRQGKRQSQERHWKPYGNSPNRACLYIASLLFAAPATGYSFMRCRGTGIGSTESYMSR